jgi:hypothetical protein
MATSSADNKVDGSEEVSECRGLKLVSCGEELQQRVLAALQACQLPDDRLKDVGEGGPFADGESQLDLAACARGLQTGTTLGQVLLAAGVLPSTHSFLQLNGHLLPDGVVLVADKQAGGKGALPLLTHSEAGIHSPNSCSPHRGIPPTHSIPFAVITAYK